MRIRHPDRLPGLHVGVRKDDRELIATHPERAIATTHDRCRDLADGGQEAVARIVAVAVVDGLESIDVEQQQGDRDPVAVGVVQLSRQLVLEGAVVSEPRQAVEQCRPPGLAVHLLHFGSFEIE